MMYRCTIAYDGTDYRGWQMQEQQKTVAGALDRSFKKVFGHKLMGLVAASRTDAGVHGYGQVIRCRTHLVLEPDRLREIWNRALPRDVILRNAAVVDASFHPQHNVQEKRYWYHIFIKRPLPFCARYGAYMPYPINLQRLEECLSLCIGTHDFRSFCTGDYDTTTRTITRIHVRQLPRFGALRIEICGPSFLYLMVRRIVGSALYIASRPPLSVAAFEDVFAAHNPLHMLPTAPAHGLLLRKIMYCK